MSLSPGKLWGMRRMADAGGRFKMTAVDQRPPIKNPIKEKLGVDEAPLDQVQAVKRVLTQELAPYSSAMLMDPTGAYPAAIDLVSPTQGLIVTLEDSIFAETPGGRLSSEIDHWSVAKIKRMGGDAVKALAWYRPDADPEVCRKQQDLVARMGEACRRYDLPFVFELLVYPLPGDDHQTTDYVEQKGKRPQQVLDSVRTFADARFGVDLFKLESPIPAPEVPDPDAAGDPAVAETQAWFDQLGEAAGRPWVMLSAGAGMDAFRRVVTYAFRAGASGYLAGRAIWLKAFQSYPDLGAMADGLRAEGVPYMQSLNRLTDAAATPWFEHPAHAGRPLMDADVARFRETYGDFGVKA